MYNRRSSQRLKNKNPIYSITYEILDYTDFYNVGNIVKLKKPNTTQNEFPWGIIERVNKPRRGDYFDIIDHPAFQFRHIKHIELLQQGKIIFALSNGWIKLTDIDHDNYFTNSDKFEIFLLRNERMKNDLRM
eukprot:406374_1